jgi:5,10-methylenetetrahydromethanopterin reductase
LYLQDAHPLREDETDPVCRHGFGHSERTACADAIVPGRHHAPSPPRSVGRHLQLTRSTACAATFLTDDLAPDRVILASALVGPTGPNVGIDRHKPLVAMRETIEVMRRLLAMENVTYHGEFHHVEGIELDVVHGRREPRNVSVMIGATGMKMMELAGEIADGVVLNYCVPPEYNDPALEHCARRRAGRAGLIDRPQLVVSCIRGGCLDGARALLTQYLTATHREPGERRRETDPYPGLAGHQEQIKKPCASCRTIGAAHAALLPR